MTQLPVYLFLVVAIVSVVGVAFLLKAAWHSNDEAPFWATLIAQTGWLMAAVLIVRMLAERQSIARWLPEHPSGWFMSLLALWVVLLLVGLRKATPPEGSRWLVGTLGFGPKRYWLILFALPILWPLISGAGAWDQSSGAAVWGSGCLFGLAIIGAGLSADRRPSRQPAADPAPAPRPPLATWPDVMRAAGVQLEPFAILPASTPARAHAPSGWELRLSAAGAVGLAPRVIQEVEQLVDTAPSDPEEKRTRLIVAPDNAGQCEAVALAAVELAARSGQVTLVITPEEAVDVAANISRWAARLGGPEFSQAAVATAVSDPELLNQARIWVVDARTLSENFLRSLSSSAPGGAGAVRGLAPRIGLTVWWDVHEYSGVTAANVWAISRRFERVLRPEGSPGRRSLVFARKPAQNSAQMSAFIRHLLPCKFSSDNVVNVDATFERVIRLYKIPAREAEKAIRLATAALDLEWTVNWTAGESGSPSVFRERGRDTGRTLTPDPAEALLRVLELSPEQVLSLSEILCHGGRGSHEGMDHHVVISVPDNPYLHYLLGQFGLTRQFDAPRVLIRAAGHPSILSRHIELALREVSDTQASLQEVFLREEDTVRGTLEELSASNRLDRSQVRYLTADGHLKRDYLYSSRQPKHSPRGPLRTVGSSLVEVRDPSVAGDAGLCLEVDPPRATIDAYPRRVFFKSGVRYRVSEWSRMQNRQIACHREDLPIDTWRCHFAQLLRLRGASSGITMRGLIRYVASVDYSEELSAILERSADGRLAPYQLTAPVRTTFETRALFLESRFPADAGAMRTVALILQHIVPVHVGVESDHLEVVPLFGNLTSESGSAISGLALVDLAPGGGVGLADAIQSDQGLIEALLEYARRWLEQSLKSSASSAGLFDLSPQARARGSLADLRLQPALSFLNAVCGISAGAR